jgi:hypothetical protein
MGFLKKSRLDKEVGGGKWQAVDALSGSTAELVTLDTLLSHNLSARVHSGAWLPCQNPRAPLTCSRALLACGICGRSRRVLLFSRMLVTAVCARVAVCGGGHRVTVLQIAHRPVLLWLCVSESQFV